MTIDSRTSGKLDTAEATTKSKEIVIETKVTGKLAAVLSVPFASALALGFFGLDAWKKFGPQDPTRFLFAGVPILIAVILLGAVLGICFHFLGRKITITKETITYQDSKVTMTLDIADMAYSPPNSETSMLRTLMFSDGRAFVQIPALFLGDKMFDRLAKYIKRSRRNLKEADQKTYSL